MKSGVAQETLGEENATRLSQIYIYIYIYIYTLKPVYLNAFFVAASSLPYLDTSPNITGVTKNGGSTMGESQSANMAPMKYLLSAELWPSRFFCRR